MANDFAAAAKPDRQTAIFGRMPRAKAKHLASRNFTPKSVRDLMEIHRPPSLKRRLAANFRRAVISGRALEK